MASKEVHHRRRRSRRHQIQNVSVAHEGVHAATGPASDPGEVVAAHPGCRGWYRARRGPLPSGTALRLLVGRDASPRILKEDSSEFHQTVPTVPTKPKSSCAWQGPAVVPLMPWPSLRQQDAWRNQ